MAPEKSLHKLTSRIIAFLEHGSLQTLLGIVGGLVGTFLDGRYFACLGIWLSYSLNRSKALIGLRKVYVFAIHCVVVTLASGALFYMGTRINTSRPHAYTPAEYLAAIKAGTPLPITQQVAPSRSTLAISSQPTRAHAVFSAVEGPANDTSGNVAINVGFSNQGPGVILHESSLQTDLSYTSDLGDKGCDKTVLIRSTHKPSVLNQGASMGLHDARFHSVYPSNTGTSFSKGLYLVASIAWRDDAGLWLNTLFEYFSFADGQWHDCRIGEGEHRQ